MAKKLTDESLMTFGAHQGAKLANVPDLYFRWFYKQTWAKKKYPRLYKYIEENEDIIFNDTLSSECDATEIDIY